MCFWDPKDIHKSQLFSKCEAQNINSSLFLESYETLNKEAAMSSEMLVSYGKTTRYHDPEESDFRQ
jgi:hypothetical protein